MKTVSQEKINFEAKKHAQFVTGYLPPDCEEYIRAYTNFKNGYVTALKDQSIKITP